MAELSAGRIAIAFVLGLSCAVAACGGDDTGSSTGTGGTTGTGGSTGTGGVKADASSGGGGTATGGSTGTGGTGTGGATGGSTGTGGAVTDAAGDRSTGGTNDSGPRSDASDATVASDARDATPTTDVAPPLDVVPASDATDAVATSDVSDAGIGSDATDGTACPVAGDGGLHTVLYSFDLVDGGATGIGDWQTFSHGPITSSSDDSAGEGTANPGALHATITYAAYGDFPVLERPYFAPFGPGSIDLSCYTRMHSWIKFGSPVTYVKDLQGYVLNAGAADGYGPFDDHQFNGILDQIGDGNWHELITTLPADKTAILKFGFQLPALDVIPDAGTPPAVPPPVEVFIDNIWFE